MNLKTADFKTNSTQVFTCVVIMSQYDDFPVICYPKNKDKLMNSCTMGKNVSIGYCNNIWIRVQPDTEYKNYQYYFNDFNKSFNDVYIGTIDYTTMINTEQDLVDAINNLTFVCALDETKTITMKCQYIDNTWSFTCSKKFCFLDAVTNNWTFRKTLLQRNNYSMYYKAYWNINSHQLTRNWLFYNLDPSTSGKDIFNNDTFTSDYATWKPYEYTFQTTWKFMSMNIFSFKFYAPCSIDNKQYNAGSYSIELFKDIISVNPLKQSNVKQTQLKSDNIYLVQVIKPTKVNKALLQNLCCNNNRSVMIHVTTDRSTLQSRFIVNNVNLISKLPEGLVGVYEYTTLISKYVYKHYMSIPGLITTFTQVFCCDIMDPQYSTFVPNRLVFRIIMRNSISDGSNWHEMWAYNNTMDTLGDKYNTILVSGLIEPLYAVNDKNEKKVSNYKFHTMFPYASTDKYKYQSEEVECSIMCINNDKIQEFSMC